MDRTCVLDFLEHFGVKGQQWGVRKSRGDRSSFQKQAARNSGKFTPKSKSAKPPNTTKHLTNQEMRYIVERMQLNQQYAQLSKPKAKAGSQYAKGLIEKSGNVLIGAFVTAGSAIVVKSVMTKLGK